MDLTELAFEQQERGILAAVCNSRNYTTNLKPTGKCLNCGEDVEGPKLYCNSDCAENHDRKLRMTRRNRQ